MRKKVCLFPSVVAATRTHCADGVFFGQSELWWASSWRDEEVTKPKISTHHVCWNKEMWAVVCRVCGVCTWPRDMTSCVVAQENTRTISSWWTLCTRPHDVHICLTPSQNVGLLTEVFSQSGVLH